MRRIALSALALAMTLGSASLVAAQQPGQPPAQQRQGRRGEWQRGHRNLRKQLFQGIRLSEQQKTQIKAINERYRAQLKQAREALRPAMQEARADRQKGDQAAARAVFERNKGQFEQLRAQRQQELREIRAVLTPDQRKQLDANVAQLKERMQRRQEGRREHRQS